MAGSGIWRRVYHALFKTGIASLREKESRASRTPSKTLCCARTGGRNALRGNRHRQTKNGMKYETGVAKPRAKAWQLAGLKLSRSAPAHALLHLFGIFAQFCSSLLGRVVA